MKMIELEHLTKTFKVLNRKEGLKGAISDLFSKDYKYVTPSMMSLYKSIKR